MKFFEKGKMFYEKGDLLQARLELKNALQIDPNFVPGYYYAGLVALKEQDFRQAFGAFSKAVELEPNNLLAQLEIGRLYLAGQLPDKALEKAEVVLAAEPASVNGATLKASALMRQKNDEAARRLLNGLLDRGVTEPDVFLLLARAAIERNDVAGALGILEKGAAANPGSVDILALSARVQADVNNYSAAEAALRQVIAIEPEKVNHRFAMAGLLWQAGQPDRVDRMIAEIIAGDPLDEENRIGAARFFLHQNQAARAEETLREGIAAVPQSFRLRFALAEFFLDRNQPDAAEATLRECLGLEKGPENPLMQQARTLLARALLANGRTAPAESLVDEVIRVNPKNIDAHFIKGRLHMLRKDGEAAVAEFRTVVTEKPEVEAGHLNLAEAHLLNGQTYLAIDTLRQAIGRFPESKDLHRALAQVYAVDKNIAEAEKHLDRILEIDPGDSGARAELGDLYLATGRPGLAESAYRELITQAPDKPLGYIKLSLLYQKEAQLDKAVAVLEEAGRRNPQSRPLLASLVQTYIDLDQFDQAVEKCRALLAQDPADALAYNLLGAVYAARKDFTAAEKALEKAAELQPLWPAPYNNLARIFLAQGKTDAAIAKFERALAANPQNLGAYLALGSIYVLKNDPRNAVRVYQQALDVQPGLWAAANNLAFLLGELSAEPKDLQRALSLALKADDLQPNEPLVLDTLAWIQLKLGDLAAARENLSDALVQAPGNPVFNYHMGVILHESGNLPEAKQKLETALASNQEFTGRNEARELLEKIR